MDFIVIGAGIAGASAAAELAAHGRVLLLESETHAGYHATGRSAAFFAAEYGNAVVRGLTALSEHFFFTPPEGFTQAPLIRGRDCMFFGRKDQEASLRNMHRDNPDLRRLDGPQVRQRVPIFAGDYVAHALWTEKGGDLDVDAVLQGYLRKLRREGGEVLSGYPVTALSQRGGSWEVTANQQSFRAPIVVNAAGAWADPVAEMGDVGPLGITPMRRTAFTIDPPDGVDFEDWPLMIDVDEDFYFKPDAGQILISPADETPSAPCDAQAEDIDVAIAVDRFERATTVEVTRVNHRWAGLRSFAPDRIFVVGFDPRQPGFFWLAGQGGYGVQSAPSLAQLTRALITQTPPDQAFLEVLDFADLVAPERLIDAAAGPLADRQLQAT